MSRAPTRIVQFADLHFYGAANGRLRGIATLPALEAALATARAREAPWEALLLTGDLVQDDPVGYQHVRRLFGASPVPVYCIPGNHDEQAPMRAALAGAPFQICGTARHGEWLFVMLDSYQHGMPGRLAASELARLDAALAANADRHALVCLHHHPVAAGSRWLDTVGLGMGTSCSTCSTATGTCGCCSGVTSTRPSTASAAASACSGHRRPARSSSRDRTSSRSTSARRVTAGSSCTRTAASRGDRLGRERGRVRAAAAHLDRLDSTISKSSLLAPQSGQLQSAGTSLQRVPGGMPRCGSPCASS